MSNKLYFNDKLKKHIADVSGKNEKNNEKAFENMIFEISGSLSISGISVDDYIEDYNNDNIIENLDSIFIDGETLKVNHKYSLFAKIMYSRRSNPGLGTPNAACGEGEAFLVFCSPRVNIEKKQKEGDLSIDDNKIELKGDGIRLFGGISGNELKRRTDNVGKKYNIEGNLIPGGSLKGKKAFEIWGDKKKNEYWTTKFNEIGKANSISFIIDILSCVNINVEKEIVEEKVFSNDVFNKDGLIELILKGFWVNTVNESKYDYFISIDSDFNCHSIKNTIEDFNNKFDKNKIVDGGNFFRIAQSNEIGWYIKFNI